MKRFIAIMIITVLTLNLMACTNAQQQAAETNSAAPSPSESSAMPDTPAEPEPSVEPGPSTEPEPPVETEVPTILNSETVPLEESPAETETPAEQTPALPETENTADTVSVIDTILAGFSAKSFTDGIVTDEQIEAILLSGQKAPSARNIQPWHFTVVRNNEINSSVTRGAPEGSVVIIISGLSEEMDGVNVDFDCGLAAANMYIAAQSLGLGAHIYMGGVDSMNSTMKDTLGIPDGYDVVIFMLIGYMDESMDAVSSASVRNPLDDVVNYVE